MNIIVKKVVNMCLKTTNIFVVIDAYRDILVKICPVFADFWPLNLGSREQAPQNWHA